MEPRGGASPQTVRGGGGWWRRRAAPGRVALTRLAPWLVLATALTASPSSAQAQAPAPASEALQRASTAEGGATREGRLVVDELQRGPDLRTVQRAALTWHALDRPPPSPARSRSAHLLPDRVEVSGGWVRGGLLRDDVTVTEDFDATGALDDTRLRVYGREDGSERYDARIAVRWDLSGLVWSGDELAIDAAERRAADQRRMLMQLVADAWYARRRALMSLLVDPPGDPLRRLEREIHVDEATARLDALTGGWYSVQLAADQRERGSR